MEPQSLKEFCQAAGNTFCMGEVFTSSSDDAKQYTNGFIDSVHSYPLYDGIKRAFVPGTQPTLSVQTLLNKLSNVQGAFDVRTVTSTRSSSRQKLMLYTSSCRILPCSELSLVRLVCVRECGRSDLSLCVRLTSQATTMFPDGMPLTKIYLWAKTPLCLP
jgi:hypothetical protein